MAHSVYISKHLQFLLLYNLIGFLPHFSLADPPYRNCSSNISYANDNLFQVNLNSLLNSLPTNASVSKFYNASNGNDPNRVYSLYMCLNYIPYTKCQDCLANAVQDIVKVCPNAEEAVIWEEECQLRYSNRDFFGKLDVTGNIGLDNIENISDPESFKSTVNETLTNLAKQASFNISANMYATSQVPFQGQTLYALVQCARDLSPYNCNKCLQTAIEDIIKCCYTSIGARLLSRSCYLRYEIYNFYRDETFGSSDHDGKSSERKIIIALAIVLGLVMMATGSCLIYYMKNRAHRRENDIVSQLATLHNFGDQGDIELHNGNFHKRSDNSYENLPYFDLKTLYIATKGFSNSNKLGEGGFGPVYKGLLNGKEVAIKRLSNCSEQGSEEFINEVLLIFRLQHKNLVKLLGFCVDGDEKLLVYEFMAKGSLDVALFDPKKRARLDWMTRVNIIKGIARGILYLHEDSRLRIVHRDLKLSNVLLDNNMNPKISDFGMAKIFAGTEAEANTATIIGTYGYMAPEYAMDGLYSTRSDVFSFGVLVLEIISGRQNAGFFRSKQAPSLLAYAWQLWNEGNGLELMDPPLTNSCHPDEFRRYMHIGLLCVQEDAYERPIMSSAVLMMTSESVTLTKPDPPPLSVARLANNNNNVKSAENCSINALTISNFEPR